METPELLPPIQRPTKTYRNITPIERDQLFAIYEKHNGNVIAMTRDPMCQFKSKNQLYYYKQLFFFEVQLGQIRAKEAREMLETLKASKNMLIKRAIAMLEPRQVPLRDNQGNAVMDRDGDPIFVEFNISGKDLETVWKIIKAELKEPTTVSKFELEDGTGQPIQINNNVVVFQDFSQKPDAANS